MKNLHIGGAVALAALGIYQAPAGAATTITIDASTQTAGNPHFWSASVGTGTASLALRSDLQTHYKIGNREAGFMRVRGHGVLNDDIGIYKSAGSYNWTNFDKYLTAISQAGMRPIMEMSFMPTALALNGSNRDIYKNATDYKNFITAVVQHCVDRFGMDDVSQWYWEIWNEPDYAGFWNGSNASENVTAKMTEYYGLYDNAVAAITSVIPKALVGGPATTGTAQVPGFLQHCKSAGTRVTFASSHVYPGGSNTGSSADGGGLLSDNNTRVSQITSAGYSTSDVLSFNTEWNSSYSGQGGLTGDVVTSMDNNWNVGFILKGAKLLSDKNSGNTPPIAVMSYWVLSDVFDESSGPSGSYILGKNSGQLPFGQVFGLMTAQGMRKAAFNAFKLLNMTGPVRLKSAGGTGSDGVDAMATTSSSGDSLQVLVYDAFAKMNTSGSDMVTINISNLPPALSGKTVFVTQYTVDATHSNPYSVWQSQNSPGSPTEAQWEAMRAAQHLYAEVKMATLTTSYSTSFSINRQAGTLLVLSTKRPVTGRDGLTTIEGEDYDGQSGATKEDSNDTDVGQSISVTSGGSVFYDVVDFSDAGVGSVQMRVQAASATNIEFHADTASGPLLGKCAVSATGTSWATQSCTLTPTTGVHTLYALFGGAAHLNWLLFQAGSGGGTGTGGTSGGTGGSTATGGSTGKAGSGGTTTGGAGGSKGGTGGSSSSGTGGQATVGSGGSNGSGGNNSPGTGGSASPGSGGSNNPGSGGNATGTGSGGSAPASGGSSGCSCDVTGRGPGAGLSLLLIGAAVGLARRRRRLAR